MKKLIYSKEDLDLMLCLETQEYEDKINNLQSKIDKAIEYIENNSYFKDNVVKTMIFKDYSNGILDILKEDK